MYSVNKGVATNLTYGDILILNDYSHFFVEEITIKINRRLKVYCNLIADKV